MTLALLLYVCGWVMFLIPNQIPGGGVTGLSSIINYAFGIPISYTYFIVNMLLLVAGTFILGKGFGFKTIYCIVVSTLFFQFLPLIPWQSDIPDKLINALIGGGFSGIGIAIVFMQGGSTGGIDIIALAINKYREISPGKVFLVSDTLIISSILFLPDKSLQDVVYGYVITIAFTYTVDTLLTGVKQSVQISIISDNFGAIADKLTDDMDRGVTAISSLGWYTHKQGQMLIVVCKKNQITEIMQAVKELDNRAFITIASVMSVYGERFERIK